MFIYYFIVYPLVAMLKNIVITIGKIKRQSKYV